MTERLAAALKEYRHLRKRTGALEGRRLAVNEARGVVARAFCGAPPNVPTGVHILRHTFCSHLAMRGAPGRAIQELAAHQELSMTRYMHLSPFALNAAIRLLEGRGASEVRGEIRETARARAAK